MKKLFLVFVILFLFLWMKPVRAIDCEGSPPSGSENKENIEAYITACNQKISILQSEQNTLKQAIASINAKINLAQAQLNQTQAQIDALEKDINVLDGVLETVSQSTEELTRIYLSRVRESYRRSRVDQTNLIFSAESFSDYFVKLKYLNTVKAKDQLILAELENARQDYDSRKQDKINKQQEVEKLKLKLESQRKILVQQQNEKRSILIITQNDEKKYQKLLSEAKAQLAALKRFVNSQGGASILSNQTKCDGWGCYYNQRDSQWGNLGLGGSNYSVAEYGCLVSSVSMMASHAGKNIKPIDIATTPSAFVPNTGYLLHSFTVNGIGVSITALSKDKLDSELNAGRSVIAGMYNGPDHFIVIVKKEGDKYIMNDPFLENGSNRPLSDKYNISEISSLRVVSFN